jgi:Asp-tRNA(Asn)/Glu-tRNA(Gln) amidotransferase A subunit family amidase
MPLPAADRRRFLQVFSGLGLGSTLLPGVLWAKVAAGAEITDASIAAAEEIAGVTLTPEQRTLMLQRLKQQTGALAELFAVPLDNAVAPAVGFLPAAVPQEAPPRREAPRPSRATPRAAPARIEELAFASVVELGGLIRARKVSSEQLTRMYLDRLEAHDPALFCVVNRLPDRALAHAKAMDEEVRRGKFRSPLHGIPWGAKDLLAAKGAPTTWGIGLYKDRVLDEDATVVRRLEEAGAVLVAKLSLGELAQGDVWFGGTTRNPWKPDQGSSGSSAGSASATAAGLVGFTIGSETLGSISSPATRCGVTGLRPTFGRVPRTGAMALSWTMDKLGPLARSAEDCALVLDAIHGPDGGDLTAQARPYRWDADRPLAALRIGVFRESFANARTQQAEDAAVLDVLRAQGAQLRDVAVPAFPYNALRLILSAEAGAAFDALTRSGQADTLVQQHANAWPNTFRLARFISAVDYVNANRVRSLAMAAWDALFRDLDVIVAPTNSVQLMATNLTGHPAVIVPNGFRADGTPFSITFVGKLWGEAEAALAAHAFQRATDFHRRVPPQFTP